MDISKAKDVIYCYHSAIIQDSWKQ